jgi:intracellular sulfur oxidation DsrE/DsrF family protein
MSPDETRFTDRRRFLTQVGAAGATLLASGTAALEAEAPPGGPWDLSWVDKLTTAKYRVVFDVSPAPADAYGPDHAGAFLDQFHEVYGTRDDETRAVLVFRQLGTALALNNSMWQRYPVDEKRKTNPYLRRPDSTTGMSDDIETLASRGVILLVCNIALGNVVRSLARATSKDATEVRADAEKNLVPGTIIVPSGVFALIRAQNAGCAYMRQ